MKTRIALVLSLLATSSYAELVEPFVAELSAKLPRDLVSNPQSFCIEKDAVCTKTNSQAMEEVLDFIAKDGSAALRGVEALQTSVHEDAAAKNRKFAQFPQAKMMKAAQARVQVLAQAYFDAYSPGKFRDLLIDLETAARTARDQFAASEKEARGVTAGRKSYLDAKRNEYQRQVSDVISAAAPFAAFAHLSDVAAKAIEKVAISPKGFFESECDRGIPFGEITIDVLAEYDFLMKLTAEKPLTLACKDTSDRFLSIGMRSDSVYDREENRLMFYIGERDCGRFGSSDCYVSENFWQGYAKIKNALSQKR